MKGNRERLDAFFMVFFLKVILLFNDNNLLINNILNMISVYLNLYCLKKLDKTNFLFSLGKWFRRMEFSFS
ncbi:hypothetical protein DDT91_11365 [Algoriphagus sp. AK58]|nr:hypothetical protein [Algoriphagus sp. AK58]